MIVKAGNAHLRLFNLGLAAVSLLALTYLGSSAAGYFRDENPARGNPVFSAPPAVSRRAELRDYQVIIRGNPFDPESRNDGKEDSRPPVPDAETAAPLQRADVILLGTVVVDGGPFAMIRTGGKSEIFRLDENVPGVGRVKRIERKQVTLSGEGGRPWLLELAESSGPGSTPMEPLSDGPGILLPKPEAPNPEITPLGANRFRVSRQASEKAAAEFGQLVKEAVGGGRPIKAWGPKGFILRRLRPSSVLRQLGLRPGDLLKEINGMAVDGPEQWEPASRQLAGARKVAFGLLRRGTRLTIEYEVE
ncbi:MAG: hypothetical protein JXB25_03835 [Deltaproteobacteria bacterium]|nr:hypothetical protein [Deltaproteobacteria bacterium]